MAVDYKVEIDWDNDGFSEELPTDITTLKLWLKANAIVGLNDGDVVTTWSDASGNGNDAIQSTVAKKPIYKTNIVNGLPVVRFDGTDDYFSNTLIAPLPWTSEDEYTAIIVIAFHTPVGSAAETVFFNGYDNGCVYYKTSAPPGYRVTGWGIPTGMQGVYKSSMGIVTANTFEVITISRDRNKYVHLYKNGVNYIKYYTTVPLDPTTDYYIGCRHATHWFLDGDVAEILYFQDFLGDYDRTFIENYLKLKYGLSTAIGGDDISSYVKSIDIERGRETQLDRIITGRCTLVLKNNDARFSPTKVTSPLYPNVQFGKRGRVSVIKDAVTYYLFEGFITSIKDFPQRQAKESHIELQDALSKFIDKSIEVSLQQSQTTGTLIDLILDSMGWYSMKRTMDVGRDTILYSSFSNEKGLETIQNLCDSERGIFLISNDGKAKFEDRHHRYKSPHNAVVLSIDNNSMRDFVPDRNYNLLFNDILIKAHPIQVKASAELWYLRDTISIVAGDSTSIDAEYSDPDTGQKVIAAVNVVTPVATTDYTANSQPDGLGTDLTTDMTIRFVKLDKTAKIEIANNAAITAYITFFRIRGQAVVSYDVAPRTASDSTSQMTYGKRTLDLDLIWQQRSSVAKDFADYLLSQLKAPLDLVEVMIFPHTDALETQMFLREISDRVSVAETLSEMDDEFYIEGLNHFIKPGIIHETHWKLIPTDRTGDYWILGISELGTTTRLAY